MRKRTWRPWLFFPPCHQRGGVFLKGKVRQIGACGSREGGRRGQHNATWLHACKEIRGISVEFTVRSNSQEGRRHDADPGFDLYVASGIKSAKSPLIYRWVQLIQGLWL